MDWGACLGCGLGVNAPLQTNDDQGITWQSGKPNPMPIFEKPDEFYTPFIIPGPYMPVDLIAPLHEQDGLFYHPLPDADTVDTLLAFAVHEGVHIAQFLGIIPTAMRLAAATFYTTLVMLLSKGFDPHDWSFMNNLNNSIRVIHSVTAPMHEVAAIIENLFSSTFNNPFGRKLIIESANNYAGAKYTGEIFTNYSQMFYFLIQLLYDEYFSPIPLSIQTIIALADYIISSAIDWQEFENGILRAPLPIADASLRDHFRRTGIPYLSGGNRSLDRCPTIHAFFGGFTVQTTGPRLARTIETILSAKVKRPRKKPENYIDQLLYIAELAPELKLWLKSLDARHWFKRRILNVISDYQNYLEQQCDVSLPLVGVWEHDLSAFIAVNYGYDGKTLDIKRVGCEREDFRARAVKIPHEYWLAYDVQEYASLGVSYYPVCIEGRPISPGVRIIGTPDRRVQAQLLMNLIFFESLRIQLANGCGLVCPFEGDDSCCGRASVLWQVYNLGQTAMDKADWHPAEWNAPECRQPKTKRIRKKKAPETPISRDSNIFL